MEKQLIFSRKYLSFLLTLLQASGMTVLVSFVSICSESGVPLGPVRFWGIFLGLFLSVLAKFLIREEKCSEKHVFLLLFASHYFFTVAFLAHNPDLSCDRSSVLIFSTVHVHPLTLIDMVNSFWLAVYLTAVHFYIEETPVYTETQGLLVYCGDTLGRTLRDAYFAFVAGPFLGFSVLLFCTLPHHLAFRIISPFLRVKIIGATFPEILTGLVFIGISNAVYSVSSSLLGSALIYNCSFVSKALQKQAGLAAGRFALHQTVLVSNSAQVPAAYFDAEFAHISAILGAMEEVIARYENSTYVTVPQVHRNYSKKVRSYNVFDMVRSFVVYRMCMFSLPVRFFVAYDNVLRIGRYIVRLCARDPRLAASQNVPAALHSLLKRIVSLEKRCGLELESYKLDEILKSLTGRV